MALNAIQQMENVRVRMVGRGPFAVKECVRTICMDRIAITHVNATKTILKFVILGTENVIVKLVGAVVCAIDHVRS